MKVEPKRGLTFTASTHVYRLDGHPVPSVTGILGVLDKPAIPRWAASQVAEYVADNPDGIDALRAMGRGPMVQALKGIPWSKRDTAAARGNVLHDYAEHLLNGEEIDVADEHVPVMEAAIAFMEDWCIEPILTEFACGSREHRWAGTGDLAAAYTRPDDGTKGVGYFDWKSAKRLYPEHALQFAPYMHPEFVGLNGDESPPPAYDGGFGVHIRADGYDVHEFKSGPDVYREFLVVRESFDIAKRVRGDWRVAGSGYMSVPVVHQRGVA